MLEVKTDIWGRKFWYIIHYLANKFDDKYIIDYHNFFLSLEYLIPCPVCKKHYSELKIEFENRDECIDWVFNIHNIINKRIGNNVYFKKIVNKYNSKEKFYKYFYDIEKILLKHDSDCFLKLKYFFKIICLIDDKFNNIYKQIPIRFLKNERIYKWIDQFNMQLLS